MKRTGLLLGAAAVTLWSAGAFAQGRNFAGTWTVDSERMAAAGGVERVAAGGGGGGGGARVGGGGGMSAGSGGAVMRTGSGGGGGFGGGRGGSAGGGAVMSAGPMSVTLDAATFAVGSTAYRLDGSVTTMETPRGGVTAKAAWKGDKIVVETTSQGPNGPITSTATWYLEGDSLVRETSTPAPDGGDPRVSKMYYKRS